MLKSRKIPNMEETYLYTCTAKLLGIQNAVIVETVEFRCLYVCRGQSLKAIGFYRRIIDIIRSALIRLCHRCDTA